MGLEISEEFGLVALVVAASFFVHMYMASGVVAARKKYGVHYPTMYAVESVTKDAKLFNCVQRGHQNFLEVVPFFLSNLVLGALQHPRIATVFGFLFLAARVLYFKDYSTGDPKKRMRGSLAAYFSMFVLVGCSVSFAVQQVFLR